MHNVMHTYQSDVRELRVVKELDNGSRTCSPREQNQVSCIECLLNTAIGDSCDLRWRPDTFTVCVGGRRMYIHTFGTITLVLEIPHLFII